MNTRSEYMELPIRALSEEGIDFEMLEAEAGHAKVSFGGLQKQSESAYTYQLRFRPSLKIGDTVRIKYRITIPQYKLATRERALAYISATGNERKDLKNESTTIRNTIPTDELRCRIVLAPECGAVPAEIQPKWLNSQTLNIEELERLRGSKSIYCQEYDSELGYIMELNRKNPMVGMAYTFSWELPSEDDI